MTMAVERFLEPMRIRRSTTKEATGTDFKKQNGRL